MANYLNNYYRCIDGNYGVKIDIYSVDNLRHSISVDVDIAKNGHLCIPCTVALKVNIVDYEIIKDFLGIQIEIEPKKVTFKSSDGETSKNLKECTVETITESLLGYLENFQIIKNDDDFIEGWEIAKKELYAKINGALDLMQNFNLDNEIAETEQKISELTHGKLSKDDFLLVSSEFIRITFDKDKVINSLLDYWKMLQNLTDCINKEY